MTDYTPDARGERLAWSSLMPPRRYAGEALCFTIAFVVALLLYVPLLSIRYDINAIIEAQAVERGGTDLFSPNRLVYRAIGALGYELALGGAGQSLPLLQRLSAIFSALAIGVFCVVTFRVTRSLFVAFWAAALLATSWSFWTYSTDAYYITPAALATFCALALLAPGPSRLRAVIGAAVFTTLGILLWQANVFFVPIGLGLLLFYAPRQDRRRRATNASVFLVVLGALTVASYLVAAFGIHGVDGGDAFLDWFLSHGSDRFGRPPIWGVWSLDRVPWAFHAAVSSWIPVWDGLGLRRLIRGEVQPDKIMAQTSLVALTSLVGLLAYGLTRWRPARKDLRRLAWLLLVGYLVYMPFVVWWDPAPKWFVVPNAFLILAVGLMLAPRLRPRNPPLMLLCAGLVVILAGANLGTSIYPRHIDPGDDMPTAQCFTQATTAQDVLIPLDWDWTEYATYLYGFSGAVLTLPPDLSAVDLIQATIKCTEPVGGHVYVVDKRGLPPDVKQRIRDTGYALDAVLMFEHQPAFSCGDVPFSRLRAGR